MSTVIFSLSQSCQIVKDHFNEIHTEIYTAPPITVTLFWFQMADRYRLTGDILNGQMDLDILGVTWTDSGLYCCRVDINGLFNDKKVIMNLRVVKGETSNTLLAALISAL